MATDYYPLIRKAIDRLDRPGEAARYNVYERARQALVRQLRDAGVVDAKLDEHLEALDRAVAQIEGEFGSRRPEPARGLRAVRDEPSAGQRDRPLPVREGPPPSADDAPASSLRRWGLALGIGTLAVFIAAGLSFYHFQPRQRPAAADRPAPVLAPARPAATPAAVASADAPAPPSYILRRQRVFYRTTHPPGTIAVSTSQKFLYVVQPNQVAIRYAIGVGSVCDKVAGLFHITEKVPRPSDSATARAPRASAQPDQSFEPPALYFDRGRAVHEAADAKAVGQSVRTGCFQSWGEDIADLFERISVNDRVVVAN
jgi:lipoprotein-anchoring transpeptidase ErfK/SrfK